MTLTAQPTGCFPAFKSMRIDARREEFERLMLPVGIGVMLKRLKSKAV